MNAHRKPRIARWRVALVLVTVSALALTDSQVVGNTASGEGGGALLNYATNYGQAEFGAEVRGEQATYSARCARNQNRFTDSRHRASVISSALTHIAGWLGSACLRRAGLPADDG